MNRKLMKNMNWALVLGLFLAGSVFAEGEHHSEDPAMPAGVATPTNPKIRKMMRKKSGADRREKQAEKNDTRD